ncbi:MULTISPECIES: DUF5675 family protein [Paraburkholderia]|uniref:DUF5675 family protein n=1 Tax=Paraburkholderia TaxID=1822464 RepID=UPI0038BDC244
MDRRSFLACATSVAIFSDFWSLAMAQGPIKLLVVRERGYENKCVPCVAGRLFGVPSAVDLSSAEQNLGMLSLITDTVELSYEPKTDRPSSIPEATYSAIVRADGSKKWMWTGGAVGNGAIRPDRAWRIELQNVPHRTAIQFHYGRDVNWSRGCVILGQRTATCPARGPCSFPDSPEPAVRALRDYVKSNSIASNTPILVRFCAA